MFRKAYRIAAFLLASILLLASVACSNGKKPSTTPTPGSTTQAPSGNETQAPSGKDGTAKFTNELMFPLIGSEDLYGKIESFYSDKSIHYGMFMTSDGRYYSTDDERLKGEYNLLESYEKEVPAGASIDKILENKMNGGDGFLDSLGYYHLYQRPYWYIAHDIDGEIYGWYHFSSGDWIMRVVFIKDGNFYCSEFLQDGTIVTDSVKLSVLLRDANGNTSPIDPLTLSGNFFASADHNHVYDAQRDNFINGITHVRVAEAELSESNQSWGEQTDHAYDTFILEAIPVEGFVPENDTMIHIHDGMYFFVKNGVDDEICYTIGNSTYKIHMPDGHSVSDIRLKLFQSTYGGKSFGIVFVFENGDVYYYFTDNLANDSTIIGINLFKHELLSSIGTHILDFKTGSIYRHGESYSEYIMYVIMDDHVVYFIEPTAK